MDLRNYYQQLREVMAGIADEHVVVISNATSDGGKAGVYTEVTREVAARLVVETRARLATAEEAAAYRTNMRDAQQQSEQAAAAARVRLTVISDSELRALRERARPLKG